MSKIHKHHPYNIAHLKAVIAKLQDELAQAEELAAASPIDGASQEGLNHQAVDASVAGALGAIVSAAPIDAIVANQGAGVPEHGSESNTENIITN
jgi:hypothetical protein